MATVEGVLVRLNGEHDRYGSGAVVLKTPEFQTPNDANDRDRFLGSKIERKTMAYGVPIRPEAAHGRFINDPHKWRKPTIDVIIQISAANDTLVEGGEVVRIDVDDLH